MARSTSSWLAPTMFGDVCFLWGRKVRFLERNVLSLGSESWFLLEVFDVFTGPSPFSEKKCGKK